MKTTYWFGIVCLILLFSCKKENKWEKIELTEEKVSLQFIDISQDFYNADIPLEELFRRYPFFFESGKEDEIWEDQRRDSMELDVYNRIQTVFADGSYREQLEKMFARYHYFFPQDLLPDVYTYSSALEGVYDPVIFGHQEGLLFIAMDGFLGSDEEWYSKFRIYPYMAKNMNPDNLLPMVVQAIGEQTVPFNIKKQQFIDQMVYEGKKLVLADALIPDYTEALKIGYTDAELEWAIANEGEIWNYFVEHNLLFDSDRSYRERFIDRAPYSKFLNEVEAESPGRIGVWVGWQICRKYLNNHPDIDLVQFLNEDTQVIFKESNYKPQK